MIVIESGFSGIAYPLSTPRIGVFSKPGATISASSAATGYDANLTDDKQTWTYWRPTAVPAWWQANFTASAISYVGIAAHNLGSIGGTVQLQEWNGSAWVALMSSHAPTDDSAILFLFAKRTTDRIRIQFNAAVPTVGIIMVGAVNELPTKARFTGSLPFNEATVTTYADTISDGGHVLERFALRKAAPVEMTLVNLGEGYGGAGLQSLAQALQDGPAFFADRPQDYPASVVFGRITEPLQAKRARPVYSKARDLTLKIMGFAP